MTEYVIVPGSEEDDEGGEYSRTDEVLASLEMSVKGVVTWYYTDGSFDYRPDSEEDRQLMIEVLTGLDVFCRRH